MKRSSAGLRWLMLAMALVGACGPSIPDRCNGSPFVCPAEWATGRIRTTATAYELDAETANDPVTGLMWQRKIPKEMHRWSAAREYCASLTLGGHDDWRLPSRLDLLMLVDYPTVETPPASSTTQRFGPPMIDVSAFPDTPPAMFWTASNTEGDGGAVAWVVDFGTGLVDEEVIDLLLPRTRCVRTEKQAAAVATEGRYVLKPETVREPATGLVWERSPDNISSYADAEKYCASLTRDGQGGFRLPTLKEAMSIVSAIATNFPGLDPGAFKVPKRLEYSPSMWTSTPSSILEPGLTLDVTAPGRRYIVDLGDRGRIRTRLTAQTESNTNTSATLCVRDESAPVTSTRQEDHP